MCGRFTQLLTWRQIHDLYRLTGPALPQNPQPRHNGAPTQDFAACRLDETSSRTSATLRWGLVPSWAKDVGMGVRLTPGRRPSTPSRHSAPPSAHVGAWCRPTGDSSGNGLGAASSRASWRSRTDHRYRSPRCGSAGTRAENPSSPSPSSRRRPRRACLTSTSDSQRSSTPPGSTTGSTRRRRRHDSST